MLTDGLGNVAPDWPAQRSIGYLTASWPWSACLAT
jgi:hypothetical protein